MTKHDISLHLMTKHDTSPDAPRRQAQGMTGEVPASPRARNQVRETAPAQTRADGRARARARYARNRVPLARRAGGGAGGAADHDKT